MSENKLQMIYRKNHIEGKGPALGIIPITESNNCKWGCIDIDEYKSQIIMILYLGSEI